MKTLIVLGCTGSIGTTALSLLSGLQDRIRVVGLSAGMRYEQMLLDAKQFGCKMIETPVCDPDFEYKCSIEGIKLFHSSEDLIQSCDADLVLNGISGARGLEASIAALSSGKDLALANKESMVMAGPLLNQLAHSLGRRIIPVDSEHSAIYELAKAFGSDSIDKLIITASGGPFRNIPRSKLSSVTVEQAANHPTWKMGRKISIDCATLANKALEVIEAGMLFGIGAERILTVIHPQSEVHSMVSLRNGQTYAQISSPTMRFPILNAIFDDFGFEFDKPLSKPLFECAGEVHLDFYPMDFERFPLVKCGFECLGKGGFWPIVFNAANEVAVDAFCRGLIGFDRIDHLVMDALCACSFTGKLASFDDVFECDRKARELASGLI
ncbi:MAG: 1-deoxy-D-xylulose-5-phosphate reductoisomerase [Sphaerochaetaceae bacterium]|jgi:1-deoxy-D-xylulose-5-phosphate reductoisomerase